MLYEIAPEHKVKEFEETGDVDFAYEIPALARYRANFFQQKYGIGAVFREIPTVIQTCEQLGLPPVVKRLATLPRGLVLVTGPTGIPRLQPSFMKPTRREKNTSSPLKTR